VLLTHTAHKAPPAATKRPQIECIKVDALTIGQPPLGRLFLPGRPGMRVKVTSTLALFVSPVTGTNLPRVFIQTGRPVRHSNISGRKFPSRTNQRPRNKKKVKVTTDPEKPTIFSFFGQFPLRRTSSAD
jgi:hypothetical protein